jgi:hypothetical protein
MPLHINIAAVVTAVVANFALGFVWYTYLFMKPWVKEMGYDPAMRPDGKAMAKGMVFMVIGNFLFAWVLAFYLAGWQYIPGVKEMSPVANAVNSALSVWLGFYVPVHLSAIVWERKSWKLFAINGGYHLASLIIVALILTHWT